jgi:CubicO group peptidase (beta-lactamase class C family)
MKKSWLALIVVGLILGGMLLINNVSIMKVEKALNKNNAQVYYPAGDWRISTPEEQGMDSRILADMIKSIKERGKSVNSVTIIRNGYSVIDTYFYPYQKGLRHSMNSCTKSFVSALLGTAIEDRHIESVDEKVLDYFQDMKIENRSHLKQELTLENLLTMTTGLNWEFNNNISTNQMLGSRDWTRFVLDQSMKEKPGLNFGYCNGAAHVISAIIQKTSGKTCAELAVEELQPLGIKDIYWSSSPENVTSGYSGIYMYPTDAAKFGYLYLKNGAWNGQQLIPKKWVEESTQMQTKAAWNSTFPGYGYMWWINRFGGYAALGYGGQYIFVVPKLELVAVFTGGLYDVNDLFYPGNLMESYIIPSIKSDSPIKNNPVASESLCKASDMVQNAPLPEPVNTLPDIAKKVSGKTYFINDSNTCMFRFNDNKEFTYYQDSHTFQIGLDNVFRVVDTGNWYSGVPGGGLPDHNHRALKGRWLDENTLQIIALDLEEGFETEYYVSFYEDRIEFKFKSNVDSTEYAVTGVPKK